jgi:hypothetical protein
VYLDRHMREAGKSVGPRFVERGRLWIIGYDRKHNASATRSKPPKMQISATVTADFDSAAYGSRNLCIRDGVKEHSARGS